MLVVCLFVCSRDTLRSGSVGAELLTNSVAQSARPSGFRLCDISKAIVLTAERKRERTIIRIHDEDCFGNTCQ